MGDILVAALSRHASTTWINSEHWILENSVVSSECLLCSIWIKYPKFITFTVMNILFFYCYIKIFFCFFRIMTFFKLSSMEWILFPSFKQCLCQCPRTNGKHSFLQTFQISAKLSFMVLCFFFFFF